MFNFLSLLKSRVFIYVSLAILIFFYGFYLKNKNDILEKELKQKKIEQRLIIDSYETTLEIEIKKAKAKAVVEENYKRVLKSYAKLEQTIKNKKEVKHEKKCNYVPFSLDLSH